MKVAFSVIVFNLDYILDAVLESIYPWASQILITEGPVEYFMKRGFTVSTDNTVEIIKSFPDPEKKIKLIQGQWKDKTEMVKAQTEFVDPDTTFGWVVDADEVYKQDDIKKILEMLPDYDSVAFRSLTFLGGFDYVLGGWEQEAQYHRIKRWNPAGWKAHRAAQMVNPATGKDWREYRHLRPDILAAMGIYLYHYTYVWRNQVASKSRFYRKAVAGDRVMPDFYGQVWLPWVTGDERQRRKIEREYAGVHEWDRKHRGSCYPKRFTGRHPAVIEKRMGRLQQRLRQELLEDGRRSDAHL